MARMPSAAAAAEKWKTVTPGRQNFYTSGVQGAASAYDEGVSGAGDRYAAGVTEAIGNRQWEQGVSGKGSKFAAKAANIGASRWSAGVAAAQGDYQTAVQPFFQGLASMTLPPRGSKGAPQNLERVRHVDDALRAIKVRR